jgi:hypothetical protein
MASLMPSAVTTSAFCMQRSAQRAAARDADWIGDMPRRSNRLFAKVRQNSTKVASRASSRVANRTGLMMTR